jgi:AcrR family transcriptional regulator
MTPTLTTKGRATRQRIIQGAAAEFRHSGVAATTLDDIIARTRTSKGQLFHYFPGGREDLLIAVAHHEADRVLAEQQPHLGHLGSWESWYAWRDVVVDRYRRQGDQCALSMLISQIGRSSPAARAVTTELLHRWQGELAFGITEMQKLGEIDVQLDAERAAAALVAGIQGGVVVLMATGRSDNLEAAIDLILDHLKVG